MKVLLFIGTIDFLLSAAVYTYCRLVFPFARHAGFALVVFLLALYTLCSRLLPESLPLFFLKGSAWIGGLWIAVLHYTVLLALVHLALFLLGKLFSLSLPHKAIGAAGFLFMAFFIAWGSWQAFHPVLRTEHIYTDKLPAGTVYRAAFATDLHLGRFLGRSYAETLTQRINELSPDIVLISGDILDERQSYVDRENSLAPLAQLQAPFGVYMCFGNHDYLDDPSSWQDKLRANHIQPLRNETQIVNQQLKITGLEDYSQEKETTDMIRLSPDNGKYYSILLDHQPRRMEEAASLGYVLYLAGHTHTGQLFPNRLITRAMYPLDYGRADFHGLTAITNNGYGFWGIPVRTEEAPELVLLLIEGTGSAAAPQ